MSGGVLLYLLADNERRAGGSVVEFPASCKAVNDNDVFSYPLDFAQVRWEICTKNTVLYPGPRSFAVEE